MASDDLLFQLIKDQLSAFKQQLDSLKSDVKDELDSFKEDSRDDMRDLKEDIKSVREDVESIKDDLGGQGGIRERVTAIEVKVQRAVTNTAAISSYPPGPGSSPKPRSKALKDTGMALGVGGIGAGTIVAIVEIIQTFLKSK